MKKFIFVLVIGFLMFSCEKKELETPTNHDVIFVENNEVVLTTNGSNSFSVFELSNEPVIWRAHCVGLNAEGDTLGFITYDCTAILNNMLYTGILTPISPFNNINGFNYIFTRENGNIKHTLSVVSPDITFLIVRLELPSYL